MQTNLKEYHKITLNIQVYLKDIQVKTKKKIVF